MRSATSDLEGVRVRFEAWRARRPRPRALPERLWRAAVRLLDRHSASTVCQRLRLNSSRLKQAQDAFGRVGTARRTLAVADRSSRRSWPEVRKARRAFAELPPPTLVGSVRPVEALGPRGECRVVLESVAGARLSVELARVDPAWLSAVCRLLLCGAPAVARRAERTPTPPAWT